MNIQGGALEFDVLFNSGQIDRALEETKRRVQGFSNATVEGGIAIDAEYQRVAKAIEKAFEKIDIGHDAERTKVKELTNEYERLRNEADKIRSTDKYAAQRFDAQRRDVGRELSESKKIVAEYEKESLALQKLSKNLEDEKNKIDNASNAQVRFRTQLLNVKQQMMELEQAGKKNTAEYTRLTEESKRLANAMYSVNQQTKILTSVKGATLQGFVSAFSGISGAATAAQGAIGLFADKNEDLQKVMLKVQSLMSITMGLQAMSATLHQTSAFRLTVLSKAQAFYSTAVLATGKALVKFGVSATAARIAAQALYGTLTLGLAVAIPIVISAISKYISKQKEAKKATEEFNKKVAESAGKPIATITELSLAWNRLGNNIKAKEKFIDDNKDKFNSLGVSVRNAAEAEKLLIDNKDKFIASQILKAKALAATELASEKYKEALEKMLNAEKPQKYVGTGNLGNKKFDEGSLIQQFGRGKSADDLLKEGLIKLNPQWEKYQQTMKSNFSEANKLFEQAAKFTEKEQAILAQIGQSANSITEGSIAALQKNINKLKEQYQNAATNVERNNLAKQIQSQEKLLAKMDLLSKTKKEKDPIIKDLEEKKKAYQEYFKWVNAGYQAEAKQEFSTLLKGGKTFKEYLENQKKEVLKKHTEIGEQMKKIGNGNVDLLARPMIDAAKLVEKGWKDAGTGIATVFSSQYGILDEKGKEVEILVTPILPDGSVMSQNELEDYIYNELQGVNDILKADKKGIVISVGVNQDGSAGEILHKLQDQYYLTDALSKQQKELLHKLNTAIAEETDKTIISEFEKSLQDQLNNAQTVMDMINIIKKQREELEKTTNEDDPLREQKEKIIEKQNEDVVKQQQETTKQLLSEYSSYLDKKIMLEAELTSDIELLEKQRGKALTDSDKRAIDQVIANRRKKYNEDKENLLRAGYEATKHLIDLGQNTALLNISKKTFTWEADRQIAMLNAQKQAAKRTLEELQKMQKEANTSEIAAEIDNIKLKIEELNAELDKMPNEKFQEMLSGLQKITGALGNLGGEVGEIFSSISSEIGNLQTAFDKTASKTDKIGAGIAAIVDIINMVSSASAERKRVEKEFYQNQIALAHEYAIALNEQLRIQSELSGSGFITDYAGKINDGFNALTNATKNYQEALGKLSEGKAKVSLRNAVDWGNVLKGAGSGAAIGAAVFGVVGAVVGGLVGGLVGLFGGKKKKEIFGGLLDVFPELVDETGNLNKELAQTLINTKQVDDNTRQLIQNALDWADAVAEANKQIKEVVVDLAGDLGNSLKNAMVEAWKAGEEGSKRMFEAASNSLGKFIQDLLYSTIFSQVFKDFENDLVASLNQMTGDGDVVDDYERLMQKMQELNPVYQNLLEAINERAKQMGFDFKNIGEQAGKVGLSGAIKGITQEQADLIGGTANAMRVNQVESIEILRNLLLYIASIDMKVGISNQHLEAIEENTKSRNYDPLRAEGITG